MSNVILPWVNDGYNISLTEMGLSGESDALWHVLLRWPDLDHAAVSTRAGLTDVQVVAALEELVERGFAEAAPTALGASPVDPRIAIEHAVSTEQRELAARISRLSDLRTHLPVVAEEYARGRQRIDQELPIEVVDGLEATRSRVLALARGARAETMNMDRQSQRSGMKASRNDDVELLRRGIRARTIVQRDVLDDEEMFRGYEFLAANGEEIRVVDQVPARMVLYDNEVVVVPLDSADLARGALFVRVSTIVDMCAFFFERLWREATPAFGARADDAPTGRTARVLELMAAGRKDETIARSLGVGVRTVRRDIAWLMAELDEHTRAATVAAAIRRGWLSA